MKALDRGQTPTITPDLTDELFIVQVDEGGVARDGRASIGTLLEATASSQFLVPELRRHSGAEAMGKAFGVGSKGVISLRFDDGHDAFQSTVYPLLTARGLPAAFASISAGPGNQSWWSTTTWDQVRAWNRNGIEIWSHGYDHRDPTPGGDAALVQQIVDSRSVLEAQQLKVQGWMQPGATALAPPAIPYGAEFLQIEDMWTSRAGQLIMDNYPLSEAYATGAVRPIPCELRYGLDHVTIDTVSLANLRILLAGAVRCGYGLEFMLHSDNLDDPGFLTTANFTTFLDDIVTEWNAGTIDVITPSGLAYANRTTYVPELVQGGSFEGISTGNRTVWFNGTWGTNTVETSGGRTGANFLRCPASGVGVLGQRYPNLQELNWGGETFLFDGWCRTSDNGVPRVVLQDYTNTARLNLSVARVIPNTGTWTRFRAAFTLDPDTTELSWAIGRNSGGTVDWDDISIRKV